MPHGLDIKLQTKSKNQTRFKQRKRGRYMPYGTEPPPPEIPAFPTTPSAPTPTGCFGVVAFASPTLERVEIEPTKGTQPGFNPDSTQLSVDFRC